MIALTKGSRRGAKSPNPTPSGTHSIRHVSSERSTHTVTTAHHPRKSSSPYCDLRERDAQISACAGRERIVLVELDGTEQRLCPAHAAAV